MLYIIPLMLTSTVTLQGSSLKWLVTMPVDRKLSMAVAGSINDLNDVYRNYQSIILDNFENYSNKQKIEDLVSYILIKTIEKQAKILQNI